MQGEVSYRESDDHSSSVSDLESGTGANTSATAPASTTAKKAMLFTSILLFIAACVMLVQLGNDRPPLRYDSGSPVAPHGANDNEIPNEPKQGRLEIGSFLSNAQNGGLGRYEYENSGNDEVADESEDVERVEMWTTTTEAMEAATLIDSSALDRNESSLSTLDNMEYPTSPILSDSLNGDELKEEMQSTTMFLPLVNSTTANSTTNGTLMEDSTNNPFMGSTAAKSFIDTMPAWKDSTTGSEETSDLIESSKIVAGMNLVVTTDGPSTERRKVLHMTDPGEDIHEAFTKSEEKSTRFKIPIHYTKEYIKTSQMPFLMRKARAFSAVTDKTEGTRREFIERRQTTLSEFPSTVTELNSETSPSVAANSRGYAKSEEMSTVLDIVVTLPPTEEDGDTTLRTTKVQKPTDMTQQSAMPSNTSSNISEISLMAQTNQPPLLSSEITTKVPLTNLDTVTTFKESTEIWRIPTDDSTISTSSELAITANKIAEEEFTESNAPQSSLNATEFTFQNKFTSVGQLSTLSPETIFATSLTDVIDSPKESSTKEDMVRPSIPAFASTENYQTDQLSTTSPESITTEDSKDFLTITSVEPTNSIEAELSTNSGKVAQIQHSESSPTLLADFITALPTTDTNTVAPEMYLLSGDGSTTSGSSTMSTSRGTTGQGSETSIFVDSSTILPIRTVTLFQEVTGAPMETTETMQKESIDDEKISTWSYHSTMHSEVTFAEDSGTGQQSTLFTSSTTAIPFVDVTTMRLTKEESTNGPLVIDESESSTDDNDITFVGHTESNKMSTTFPNAVTAAPPTDTTTLVQEISVQSWDASTSFETLTTSSEFNAPTMPGTRDTSTLRETNENDLDQLIFGENSTTLRPSIAGTDSVPTETTDDVKISLQTMVPHTSLPSTETSTSLESSTASFDLNSQTTLENTDISTSQEATRKVSPGSEETTISTEHLIELSTETVPLFRDAKEVLSETTEKVEEVSTEDGKISTQSELPPSTAEITSVGDSQTSELPPSFSSSTNAVPFTDITTITPSEFTRSTTIPGESEFSTFDDELLGVDLVNHSVPTKDSGVNQSSTFLSQSITAAPSQEAATTITSSESTRSTKWSEGLKSSTINNEVLWVDLVDNSQTSTLLPDFVTAALFTDTTFIFPETATQSEDTSTSYHSSTASPEYNLSITAVQIDTTTTTDKLNTDLPENKEQSTFVKNSTVLSMSTISSFGDTEKETTQTTESFEEESANNGKTSIQNEFPTSTAEVTTMEDNMSSKFSPFSQSSTTAEPFVDITTRLTTEESMSSTQPLEESHTSTESDSITKVGLTGSSQTSTMFPKLVTDVPPTDTIILVQETSPQFGVTSPLLETSTVSLDSIASTTLEQMDTSTLDKVTVNELEVSIFDDSSTTMPPSTAGPSESLIETTESTKEEFIGDGKVSPWSTLSTMSSEVTSTEDNETNQPSTFFSQVTTAIPRVNTTTSTVESTRNTKGLEESIFSTMHTEDSFQTTTLYPEFMTATPSTNTITIVTEISKVPGKTSALFKSSTASSDSNLSTVSETIDTSTSIGTTERELSNNMKTSISTEGAAIWSSTMPWSQQGGNEAQSETSQTVQAESDESTSMSTLPITSITSMQHNETPIPLTVTPSLSTNPAIVTLRDNDQVSTVTKSDILFANTQSTQGISDTPTLWTSALDFDINTATSGIVDSTGKSTSTESSTVAATEKMFDATESTEGASDASTMWATTLDFDVNATTPGRFEDSSGTSTSTESSTLALIDKIFRATQSTGEASDPTTIWTGALDSHIGTTASGSLVDNSGVPTSTESSTIAESDTILDVTQSTREASDATTLWTTPSDFRINTTTTGSAGARRGKSNSSETSTVAVTDTIFYTTQSTEGSTFWKVALDFHINTTTPNSIEENNGGWTSALDFDINTATSGIIGDSTGVSTSTESSTVAVTDTIFDATQSTEGASDASTFWKEVLDFHINTTPKTIEENNGGSTSIESSTVTVTDTVVNVTKSTEETSAAPTVWTTASDFGIDTTTPGSSESSSEMPTSTESSTVVVIDTIIDATQSTGEASDATTMWATALDFDMNATTPGRFEDSTGVPPSTVSSTVGVTDSVFDGTQSTEGTSAASTMWTTASGFGIDTTTPGSLEDSRGVPTSTESSTLGVTDSVFDGTQSTEGTSAASTVWTTVSDFDIDATTPGSFEDNSGVSTSTESSKVAVTDTIIDATQSTEGARNATTMWTTASEFGIDTTTTGSLKDSSTTPGSIEDSSGVATSTESSTVGVTDSVCDGTQSTEGTSVAPTIWTTASEVGIDTTTTGSLKYSGGVSTTTESSTVAVTDSIFYGTQPTEGTSAASTIGATVSDFDISTTTPGGFEDSTGLPTSTDSSTVTMTETIFDATQSTGEASDATTMWATALDFDVNATTPGRSEDSTGVPTSTESYTVAVTDTIFSATQSTEGSSAASTMWTTASDFSIDTTTPGSFEDSSGVPTLMESSTVAVTDTIFSATQSTEGTSAASTMMLTTASGFGIDTTTPGSLEDSTEVPISTESSTGGVTDSIFYGTQATDGTTAASTMWTTVLDFDINTTTVGSNGVPTSTESSTVAVTDTIIDTTQSTLEARDATTMWTTSSEFDIDTTTPGSLKDSSTTPGSIEDSSGVPTSTETTTTENGEILGSWSTTPVEPGITQEVSTPSQITLYTTDNTFEEYPTTVEQSIWFQKSTTRAAQTDASTDDSIFTSYESSTETKDSTATTLEFREISTSWSTTTLSPTDTTEAIQEVFTTDSETALPPASSSVFPPDISTLQSTNSVGGNVTTEMDKESHSMSTLMQTITTPMPSGDMQTTVQEPSLTTVSPDSTQSTKDSILNSTLAVGNTPTTESDFPSTTSLQLPSTTQRVINKTTSRTPSAAPSTTEASTMSKMHFSPFTSTTASKSIVSSTQRTTPVSLLFTQKTRTTQKGRNCGPSFLNKPCNQSTTISIETTSETKKPMKMKTTTPMVAQSSSVKYSNRPIVTTQPYHHYTFPLPPRPSSRQPKLQRPKNYYEYYLQKGHFPLCAAVMAFFRSFCDGFKHGFHYGFK